MIVLGLPSFYPNEKYPNTGLFFVSHFNALQRAGAEVTVACYEGKSPRWDMSFRNLRRNRFQVSCSLEYEIPTYRQYGWDLLSRKTLGGLFLARLHAHCAIKAIKQIGFPDIIHAHQAQWAGYTAYLLNRKYNLPYVITEHSHHLLAGDIPAKRLNYFIKAYKNADSVTAVSHHLANVVSTLINKEVDVTPNPVDTDFFDGKLCKSAADGIFRFVCIGRLSAEKRFDLAISAVNALGNLPNRMELLIVGEGPEKSSLEKLAASCSNKHLTIRFLGSLSKEYVRNVLAISDCLVLSSELETFGCVLTEAMSMGIPVIATNCGGPGDIVTNETGILVPPDSAEAITEAMLSIMNNKLSYESARIRQSAIDRFSYKSVGRLMIQVLSRTKNAH